MRLYTALLSLLILLAPTVMAQQVEYSFNPDPSPDLSTPFAVGAQNGARGISGPWDLDRDGKLEILVAQHSSAGGRVHVIENTGLDVWELVYSTAVIDSSASSNNTRYAIGADLDDDGNWEIVYVAGNGYNVADTLGSIGAYIWEHDGTVGSDNYGTRPASIAAFYDIDGFTSPASVYSQALDAQDVDGDGQQELIVPANGPSANDLFYVLSVTGTYQTNGAGTGFETWGIELKAGPRLNGNLLGGGSPIAAYVADLNGDGNKDISFHSWNNFALFNGTATAANTYELPDATTPNPFIKVTAADQTALFGGVVYDIDGDGNDEVFYANFFSNAVTVVDYDNGEDVLSITADNIGAEAIQIGGAGGITVGDLDQDGNPELLVGGPGYSAANRNNNQPSRFIRVAEYNGGDPKSGDSYTVFSIDTSTDADTLSLHRVMRDSIGVTSTYYATAFSKGGITRIDSDPIFPSGIAYLGDADGDGDVEVALSYQGVDDSLYVYDEVWTVFTQPDTAYYVLSVREAVANPRRDFTRIYSFSESFVLNTSNRIVLPSDYVLEDNYPNPFTDETRIRFTLPLAKQISARVYDLQGRLVRTLIADELYEAGPHEVAWDGTSNDGASAASGVYVVRLEYGNFSQSRTVVLVK